MSVHVNKESDFAKITFESNQFEDVYIETEWTIVKGGKGDFAAARAASIDQPQNLNLGVDGTFTKEQMENFI